MAEIILKLKKSSKVALERLRKIPSVVKVEFIFPDDQDDDDLAGVCAMDLVSTDATKQVLAQLKKDKEIEYAYEPPSRMLR